MLQQEVIQPIY